MSLYRTRRARAGERWWPALVFVAALLAASLLLPPTSVSACTCEYVTPLDALAHADAIVAGRVVSVAEPPAWPRLGDQFPFLCFAPNPGEPIVVTLAVDTVWKGPAQAQVDIVSQNPATDMCGAYFPVGAAYVIYAMRDGEGLRREFCQRLVDMRLAGDDLAQLGPGAVPAQPAQAVAARPGAWPLPGVLILVVLVSLLWRWLRWPRLEA